MLMTLYQDKLYGIDINSAHVDQYFQVNFAYENYNDKNDHTNCIIIKAKGIIIALRGYL